MTDSQGSYTSITDTDLLSLALIPNPTPPPHSPSDLDDSADVRSSQLVVSSELSSQDVLAYDSLGVRRELMGELCSISPATALDILAKYNGRATSQGWCRVASLRESKDNGYVQVSWAGANKFACLQTVVVWANGMSIGPGEDASHLCHEKKCLNRAHVVPEPSASNQARKGCRVWVNCPHCPKKIFVCTHTPHCIKFCAGFNDHEHFLAEGICVNVNEESPVGV